MQLPIPELFRNIIFWLPGKTGKEDPAMDSLVLANAIDRFDGRRQISEEDRYRELSDRLAFLEGLVPILMTVKTCLEGAEEDEEPLITMPESTDKLEKQLADEVEQLNNETAELHSKIIDVDVELEETSMELASLQRSNLEMEEQIRAMKSKFRDDDESGPGSFCGSACIPKTRKMELRDADESGPGSFCGSACIPKTRKMELRDADESGPGSFCGSACIPKTRKMELRDADESQPGWSCGGACIPKNRGMELRAADDSPPGSFYGSACIPKTRKMELRDADESQPGWSCGGACVPKNREMELRAVDDSPPGSFGGSICTPNNREMELRAVDDSPPGSFGGSICTPNNREMERRDADEPQPELKLMNNIQNLGVQDGQMKYEITDLEERDGQMKYKRRDADEPQPELKLMNNIQNLGVQDGQMKYEITDLEERDGQMKYKITDLEERELALRDELRKILGPSFDKQRCKHHVHRSKRHKKKGSEESDDKLWKYNLHPKKCGCAEISTQTDKTKVKCTCTKNKNKISDKTGDDDPIYKKSNPVAECNCGTDACSKDQKRERGGGSYQRVNSNFKKCNKTTIVKRNLKTLHKENDDKKYAKPLVGSSEFDFDAEELTDAVLMSANKV